MFALMISIASTAQVADPADPPGDIDPPAAPINNYLIVLALIGIYLAYQFFNSKNVNQQVK